MTGTRHVIDFLSAAAQICADMPTWHIESMALELESLRNRNGRLFIIGVGGSAGNASHAVNDFRKICRIEAYAPTDNVSELTARTNDDGWPSVFAEWLTVSRLSNSDALLVLSVGGGSMDRKVSACISDAIDLARQCGARILAIVGRPDGYAVQHGHTVVVVPAPVEKWVTPLSEAFQALIWHSLVTHPKLQ